ncbi:Phox homologous domain [Phytophthora cinnamomi]|uniref:Phox homologous domain n=1 Tax=Phytophthora cinnamomi TaxID=4785 RepID=UPI00355A2802|nr:Phox homologous domain [Phytophthora cinnamomi]
MSTAEVVATQLNDKSLRPEDTHTVSSEGSLSQSQCTPDAADWEDEFVDAMEPPPSTSGVLMAVDGTAPPLSGVYEDALEATEQQVEAALQSTSSDGSGRQSTIQEEEEDDEEAATEAVEVEAEVVAVVEDVLEATAIVETCPTPTADSREEEHEEPIHENVNTREPAHVEFVQTEDIVDENVGESELNEIALDEGYVADEDKTDAQTTSDENTVEEAELEGKSVDAGDDALPAETASCEEEGSDLALAQTTMDENLSSEKIADGQGNASVDPDEASKEENAMDSTVVSDSEQVPAEFGVDNAGEIAPCEQNVENSVEKTADIDSPKDVTPTSKEEIITEVGVVDEDKDGVVEKIQATTVVDAASDDAAAEILFGEETVEVHHPSQLSTVDTASEHPSSAIDASLESEESPGKDPVKNEVEVAAVDQEANAKDDGSIEALADEAVPEIQAFATDKDTSQEEPIAEEVSGEKPSMPADEQVMVPESKTNPAESVTKATDKVSVEGTEQEPSHPEENVNTVHAGGADAEEIIVQVATDLVEAVQVEENQHEEIDGAEACQSEAPVEPEDGEGGGTEEKPVAKLVDGHPDAGVAAPADNSVDTTEAVANAVAPEHNPAEEVTEVAPVLKEVPNSSRRKSSDDHEHGNPAAVSLLPRLAPSSGTTTTTSIDPFVLTADSNEMLEVHFPPQRFTYNVFGFSIENRVVFYHIHRSDRRTGIREPAILKRYTDFRELQIQLLDSCLRAAADMPRIPRPHLGTVLRGYKSKKTIEIREKAFRALLRYIAQYPALHGSATFERFITTSRATANGGWM